MFPLDIINSNNPIITPAVSPEETEETQILSTFVNYYFAYYHTSLLFILRGSALQLSVCFQDTALIDSLLEVSPTTFLRTNFQDMK